MTTVYVTLAVAMTMMAVASFWAMNHEPWLTIGRALLARR